MSKKCNCSINISKKYYDIGIMCLVLIISCLIVYFFINNYSEKFQNNNNSNKIVYLFRTLSCPHSINFYENIWSTYKWPKDITIEDIVLDNEKNRQLAKKFDISVVPTIYLVKDNKRTELENNTKEGLQQLLS